MRIGTVLVGTGTAGSALGVNTAATTADVRQVVFAPDRTVYFASAGQSNIRVGTPYPSLRNPGNQSTNEATRLAFSSVNLQQLGAFSNALNTAGTASLPITLTLSVQYGTLDFNNVAVPSGVTVAALVVVNAFGDVLDEQGGVLAGAGTATDASLDDARTALVRGTALHHRAQDVSNTTLCVVASDDSLGKWWKGSYTLDMFQERMKAVRRLTHARIDDAGHMLHHDQPQALAALVEGFLG